MDGNLFYDCPEGSLRIHLLEGNLVHHFFYLVEKIKTPYFYF